VPQVVTLSPCFSAGSAVPGGPNTRHLDTVWWTALPLAMSNIVCSGPAPGARRVRFSASMSRTQREPADRPGLAVLGRADLAPVRVHRGAVGVAAGDVPLDRLAHVQHAAQRADDCAAAPTARRPQRREREFRLKRVARCHRYASGEWVASGCTPT
jgi:hypothetical protein